MEAWLEDNYPRERPRNDPNTIMKRKLLMKQGQLIKRFNDFVETGNNCLDTSEVLCTDLCYEHTLTFCDQLDHTEKFIMERMEDCREPRVDAMGDLVASVYQIYKDAGH